MSQVPSPARTSSAAHRAATQGRRPSPLGRAARATAHSAPAAPPSAGTGPPPPPCLRPRTSPCRPPPTAATGLCATQHDGGRDPVHTCVIRHQMQPLPSSQPQHSTKNCVPVSSGIIKSHLHPGGCQQHKGHLSPSTPSPAIDTSPCFLTRPSSAPPSSKARSLYAPASAPSPCERATPAPRPTLRPARPTCSTKHERHAVSSCLRSDDT